MTDRSKLDAYIAELENAAYQRGVADTWAKLIDHMAPLREFLDALQREGERTNAVADVNEAQEVRAPREGSDQAKVLDAIRYSFDGLRGIEVVKELQGTVEERTVRTALHRLKNRKAIFQKDGKWFAAPSPGAAEKIEGQTPVGG
jgi:hypothetical protein